MALYNFILNGNSLTIYKEQNGFELKTILELITPGLKAKFRNYEYGEEFEICLYEKLLQETSKLKHYHDSVIIDLKEVDNNAFNLYKLRLKSITKERKV